MHEDKKQIIKEGIECLESVYSSGSKIKSIAISEDFTVMVHTSFYSDVVEEDIDVYSRFSITYEALKERYMNHPALENEVILQVHFDKIIIKLDAAIVETDPEELEIIICKARNYFESLTKYFKDVCSTIQSTASQN